MKILKPLSLVPLLCVLSLHSQTMTNESAASGSGSPTPPPMLLRGPMAALSESERAQVKAAHDLAIQQDPSLEQKMQSARQAMEQARKAMHDAMIKADPSVEPILEKLMPPKWGGHGEPGGQGATQGTNGAMAWHHGDPLGKDANMGKMGKGLANLSENERRRVIFLHEQVKKDPAVIAAREEVKSAVTPEARQAAQEKFREAMHDAMIKADPSIEPLLAKMHPGGGVQPSPSGAPPMQ